MSTAVTKTSQPTIRDRLRSPAMLKEIGMMLPKHVKPERMARVAMTAITRTPKLADCDEASFFRCLFDLSQWGLEPDGYHAHLIPFRNRKRNVTECQLIIDYKGYVRLAFQSGGVHAIHADVVRDGDLFDYDRGSVKRHTPWFLRTDSAKPEQPGQVFAAYCYVRLKDGAEKCEVLSLDEIQQIRSRSKAGNEGPWVTDFNEMAKKTAFRRVRKWIPLSAELHDVISRDEELEGIQSNGTAASTVVSGLDELTEHIEAKMLPTDQDEPAKTPPATEQDANTEKLVTDYRRSLAKQKTNSQRADVMAKAGADDRLSNAEKFGLQAYAEDLATAK